MRMRARYAVVVAGMLLQQSLPAIADEDQGRALAQRLCARCHMNEGQGEKQGPMGVPSFEAIANRPSQSVVGIRVWLRSVPPMMPNHHLTQDEMIDLADFILSLKR
jgi:mono/diheme cytochrome c family protein